VPLKTPRYVLADNGRDGCESLLKNVEKEKADVVGRVNGKGMVVRGDPLDHRGLIILRVGSVKVSGVMKFVIRNRIS
jgi:hypothetical protein